MFLMKLSNKLYLLSNNYIDLHNVLLFTSSVVAKVQESLTPRLKDWNKHKDMCVHIEIAKGEEKSWDCRGPDLPWIFSKPSKSESHLRLWNLFFSQCEIPRWL